MARSQSVVSLRVFMQRIIMMALLARRFVRMQFHRFNNKVDNSRRSFRLSTTLSCSKAQNVYKNENECLVITWNDGKVDEFPYLYLRENCRCPTCYTDERKSRTMYSPKEIDVNVTADSTIWNTDDDNLVISWGDGHCSQYSAEWLKYTSLKTI